MILESWASNLVVWFPVTVPSRVTVLVSEIIGCLSVSRKKKYNFKNLIYTMEVNLKRKKIKYIMLKLTSDQKKKRIIRIYPIIISAILENTMQEI